ncbi:MAG TPA: hypothetical protein VMF62_12335 [Acetobacteraceae bacterium]|nr:hypothetical protein [Acetobacteraceae bacterium]
MSAGFSPGASLAIGGVAALGEALVNPQAIASQIINAVMQSAAPEIGYIQSRNRLAIGLGNAGQQYGTVKSYFKNNTKLWAQYGMSPDQAAALAAQAPIPARSTSAMGQYALARQMINNGLIQGFQNASPSALTEALNQGIIFNQGSPFGILGTLSSAVNPGMAPGAITASVNALSKMSAANGGGVSYGSEAGFASAVQRSGFAGAQTGQMQGQIAGTFANTNQNAFANPFTAQALIFGLKNVYTTADINKTLGLTSQDYAHVPGLANAVQMYVQARKAGSPVAYGWWSRILGLIGTENMTAAAWSARAGKSFVNWAAPNAPAYLKEFIAPSYSGFSNSQYGQFLGAGGGPGGNGFRYPNAGGPTMATFNSNNTNAYTAAFGTLGLTATASNQAMKIGRKLHMDPMLIASVMSWESSGGRNLYNPGGMVNGKYVPPSFGPMQVTEASARWMNDMFHPFGAGLKDTMITPSWLLAHPYKAGVFGAEVLNYGLSQTGGNVNAAMSQFYNPGNAAEAATVSANYGALKLTGGTVSAGEQSVLGKQAAQGQANLGAAQRSLDLMGGTLKAIESTASEVANFEKQTVDQLKRIVWLLEHPVGKSGAGASLSSQKRPPPNFPVSPSPY